VRAVAEVVLAICWCWVKRQRTGAPLTSGTGDRGVVETPEEPPPEPALCECYGYDLHSVHGTTFRGCLTAATMIGTNWTALIDYFSQKDPWAIVWASWVGCEQGLCKI
jgi:hypothetical protein